MSFIRSIAGMGLLVLATSTLALAGCGGGAASALTKAAGTTTPQTTSYATPDARDLIALSSDFPDGYTVAGDATGPTTLADALDAAVSQRHAAAIRAQRLAGYEVTAEKVSTLQGIYCAATVYRSIGGAQRVFLLGTKDAPAQADREGWALERASTEESLGDETAEFVGSTAEGQLFTVLWRAGRVVSECGGAGMLVADPPVEDTRQVARAQQERIGEALG